MREKDFGFAFDFEGPMVTLEEGHHQAHFQTAKEVGLNLDLKSALEKLPHFLGGPDEAVAQDIFNLTHKSSPEVILEHKKRLFEEWLKNLKEIPTRKGLVKILEQLTDRKIPFAIGTATPKDKFKYYLERTPFKKYFPDNKIVFGEDVKNNKPAPDVYLQTAKIMGIKSERQIVIEDSPRGVKAAVAAKSISIGLPVYYNITTKNILNNAGVKKIYKEWTEINIDHLIKLLD